MLPASETLSEPADRTEKKLLISLAVFLAEAYRTIECLIQVKVCSSHVINSVCLKLQSHGWPYFHKVSLII